MHLVVIPKVRKFYVKIFSVNVPLESWHNHFTAIQVIDKAVRLFIGFLGGEEHDGAASFQLQIHLHAVSG